MAVPVKIPIYEHADSKEAIDSLSNSVYSKKKKKKKYFTTVFFFNLSTRTKSGEFKLLGEVMRRGQNW